MRLGDLAVHSTMLAWRQCRLDAGVDDAVREILLSNRQCLHGANAVSPQAWTMRCGDCAGMALMPSRAKRRRCSLMTKLAWR